MRYDKCFAFLQNVKNANFKWNINETRVMALWKLIRENQKGKNRCKSRTKHFLFHNIRYRIDSKNIKYFHRIIESISFKLLVMNNIQHSNMG